MAARSTPLGSEFTDYGLHAEVHDGHHAGREARRDAVLSEVPRNFKDITLSLQKSKHTISTGAEGWGATR